MPAMRTLFTNGLFLALLMLQVTDSRRTKALSTRMDNACSKAAAATGKTSDLLIAEDPAKMQLQFPWQHYLVAAPAAIYLLAQLTVIAGAGDFALTSLRNGKAKYVRYPESFSASLVQVTNEGWSAFNTAHRNMDSIQMYTYQIPRKVNDVLRIIASTSASGMSNTIRDKFLRTPLNSLMDYATTCTALAKATETKFDGVMELMAELCEGTASSRGEYEQKLKETLQAARAAKAKSDKMEELLATMKEHQQRINDEVLRHEARYAKAMDSIPTGWNALFQRVLDQMLGSSQEKVTQRVKLLLSRSRKLGSNLARLSSLSRTRSGTDNNATVDALKDEIAKDVDKLSGEAKVIEAAASNNDKQPEMPNTSAANNAPGGGIDSNLFSSEIGGNERFQAYMAAEVLSKIRTIQQENFQQITKLSRELADLMGQLGRLDMQKLDFQTKITLIIRGIELLGKIREQWATLVQFFGQIASRAEAAVKLVIPFHADAQLTPDLSDGPMSANQTAHFRNLQLSQLVNSGKDIYRAAIFLNSVSKMYISVSNQYLLGPLAGMAALIVLPAEQRPSKLAELEQQALTAKAEIERTVKEKEREYNQTIDARIAAAECVLQQLGGATDADMNALQLAGKDETLTNDANSFGNT
ncbi:hypothetical protein BV898_01472 [Hypsibius exemplaris]|uniref:Uncharacterized protein n=1 Tax=Hypsibius exemplaris TaxID=2072580 RepID=A0A1W0XBK6_HYPEX|nr:hypothetical protein BV898_01472 [Hypsibius exemplaris]